MNRAFQLFAIASFALADDLDDFAAIEAPKAAPSKERSALSVSGSAALKSAYQFDDDNARDHWRQLRLEGALEAKYAAWESAFFKINASGLYEGAKYAAAKSGAELNEAFLQARLGAADIKIGRQIVVWGKSDMLRVTDALNPLDLREPMATDIGDLRLGVAMARLDYYVGDWDLQAIAIGETRFSKRPRAPSEFAPFNIPDSDKPNDAQGAIAALGVFEGWDLSLHAASLYLDELRNHERANMGAAAAAIAIGDVSLKGEAALWRDRAGDFDKRRFLAGAEYLGFADTTIALEAAFEREGQTRAQNYAARIQRDLFNARLKLSATILLNIQEGESGGAARLQGDYEIADNYLIAIGAIDYFGDLSPYKAFEQNDRLFVRLKAGF